MLSRSWRWLLLPISVYIQTSRGLEWCDHDTSTTCEDTGQVLKNLSCGWCRSWTFGSSIADNKLRVVGLDGGALPGDGNSSHNYMVEASLDRDFDLANGSIWQLLLTPSSVPALKDSSLWSSSSNATLFNYGGRSASSKVPSGNDIPTLDTKTDQWSVVSTLTSVQRLMSGASVNAPEIKKAFYIGGYQSKYTSESASSDDLNHYTTSMVQFDTDTKAPTQIDAPFLPAQFGAASYIPVGGGALLYFGGESPPTANIKDASNCSVNEWDHVWVYDIKGNKWYKQNTTGTTAPRTEFCASTMYDAASKSWQIWAIGGADFKSRKVVDTVSILSIPSFQWFSAGAATTRMSIGCQRFGSQIFVMGGRTEFTNTGGKDYDSVAYIYDTNKQASVKTFSPRSTSYAPPASVRTAVSSASTPATWADPAVQALFMSRASSSLSTSSTPASSSGGGGGGLSGGAIGGIVVGAVLGIAAVIALVVFLFLRRRKASSVKMDGSGQTLVREKIELDAEGTQKNAHHEIELDAEGIQKYAHYEIDGSAIQTEGGQGRSIPDEQQDPYELP